MKYNKSYKGEDFEKYLEYLNTIKDKLPKDILEFVSDQNRHNFSKHSLHDSWVKSFECSSNFETKTTTITLTLSGAYFDREFRFYFQNVSKYKIFQQMIDQCPDLITYEIGIETDSNNEEKLVFRAAFSGEEAEIEIFSTQIEFYEHIISDYPC